MDDGNSSGRLSGLMARLAEHGNTLKAALALAVDVRKHRVATRVN